MRILSIVAVLVLVLIPASPVVADDSPETVYERNLPGVAHVRVQTGPTTLSIGTAFVVDAEKRLLVTAHHVCRDVKTAELIFPERDREGKLISEKTLALLVSKRYSARVIAVDGDRDLVLLQADALPVGTPTLPLAEVEPGPGAYLDLIGCPSASAALWIYSPGQVRQAYRMRWTGGSGTWSRKLSARVIESTVAGNPGDSGGPIFNSRGAIVAMHHGANSEGKAMAMGISVVELRSFLQAHTPKPQLTTPLYEPLLPPAQFDPLKPSLPPLSGLKLEPKLGSGLQPLLVPGLQPKLEPGLGLNGRSPFQPQK